MKYKYVILGGGPTGLGAAYRLKELGITDFIVLEKENFVGGLATSFVDEKGFTWDVGGHVQFSHYQYFDDLMKLALGEEGWYTHQRESWVWIRDRFVPYPFQNNLGYLPKEEQWQCLQGLIELYKKGPSTKLANFRDWILNTCGQGIADVFMFPYNFKVWAYPPEMMNANWVGERVAVSDLGRIVENIIFEKDDLSWGPNNLFQFPKSGGTGAIWKAVGQLIGEEYFRLNSTVKSVNLNAHQITLEDGTQIEYDQVMSTIPLDIFTQKCEDLPAEVTQTAQGLKHSSTHVIGIGLKGKPVEQLAKKCWMYFPEDNSPYYRITVFSNYSPDNVPDPANQWSLMAEVSESDMKPVNRTTLVEDTIKAMIEDGLIESEDQVISKFYFSTSYGYPTPSIERDGILKQVLPVLEKEDVYSRGRFGAWKYEVSNQDHSMMQGVEWANRMVHQVPELTLPFPNTANAMWGK
ncbi:NAD(P)-binding protein [Aquirufa nivalisilvae]|uniref:protoporphyrinogen/coproporphyrinogen oxidase n=1 Tax=Aquirufa nivalisilvae TaxID=2516557 RepID=UPI0022A927B4|nr:FAD-dependent oxidoreductase [Aquirufa nivalisilvae]MCZ2480201.1 NAD(P)-binding protein [Aquirufa nivalisilvae]MCZ2482404.1 NAD(P)-binding protein [Aquirufa nivalisilvae]